MNQLPMTSPSELQRAFRECCVKKCRNPTASADDFCCAGHWKLVPKGMKRTYWLVSGARAHKKKGPQVFRAAEEIVKYLNRLSIEVPPDNLERASSLIIGG